MSHRATRGAAAATRKRPTVHLQLLLFSPTKCSKRTSRHHKPTKCSKRTSWHLQLLLFSPRPMTVREGLQEGGLRRLISHRHWMGCNAYNSTSPCSLSMLTVPLLHSKHWRYLSCGPTARSKKPKAQAAISEYVVMFLQLSDIVPFLYVFYCFISHAIIYI
jgi:hypothetical protein